MGNFGRLRTDCQSQSTDHCCHDLLYKATVTEVYNKPGVDANGYNLPNQLAMVRMDSVGGTVDLCIKVSANVDRARSSEWRGGHAFNYSRDYEETQILDDVGSMLARQNYPPP